MFLEKTDTFDMIMNKLKDDKENEICISSILYTDEFIDKLKNLFYQLAKLNNKPTILIRLAKAVDFELLDIEKYENLGLDFRIILDEVTYSFIDFKKLNDKLDSYLKNIINDNMSAYEKYMAIYNFTRKFKEYKIVEQKEIDDNSDFFKNLSEIINNKNQSCNLKYILENDNIDCLGFSKLLQTLLNKAGIESTDFGFQVYDYSGNLLGGHARTLLNLDDDKYDIHGIFISDATWDSSNDDHNLEYSLLPISSMREPIYSKCNETILFDAYNETEFFNNLQTLKETQGDNNLNEEIICMINAIDRKESSKLEKLNNKDFLAELEKYILSRTNKEINISNVIKGNK